jgi:hypothetical protein
VDAARQVYGAEPGIQPTVDASGRQGVWLGGKLGGIPSAGTGVGPPNWRGHAADEFMTLEHYRNGIRYAAAIWGAVRRANGSEGLMTMGRLSGKRGDHHRRRDGDRGRHGASVCR